MDRVYSQFDPCPFVGTDFTDELSRTQQQFKDECDINTIIDRYEKTGFLVDPTVPITRMPKYGDFTGIDFHAAQNVIASAQQTFDALPATLRYRFNNDPAEYIQFCSDEKNRAEAEELGLLDIPEPLEIPENTPPEPVKLSKTQKRALDMAAKHNSPAGAHNAENPEGD
nr:MAG: internal scaffolding protein [Microviridae sp.]